MCVRVPTIVFRWLPLNGGGLYHFEGRDLLSKLDVHIFRLLGLLIDNWILAFVLVGEGCSSLGELMVLGIKRHLFFSQLRPSGVFQVLLINKGIRLALCILNNLANPRFRHISAIQSFIFQRGWRFGRSSYLRLVGDRAVILTLG
jgi:hypothetical protein